jgi:hypothetical protein
MFVRVTGIAGFPRCQALSIRPPCSRQNRVAQSASRWQIVRVDELEDGLCSRLGVTTFQAGKASQKLLPKFGEVGALGGWPDRMMAPMSRYDRPSRRVFMTFFYRAGWQV